MKQNKTERLQAEVSKIRKIKISSRGRTPDGGPNPIDTHVGNRIRLRRQLLGYSQEKLASLLGLTFQQVQKYEKGMNRVGASRLWDMGKVLGYGRSDGRTVAAYVSAFRRLSAFEGRGRSRAKRPDVASGND